MSHFSRIRTQIVEKEFLLKALEDLGYEHEEGDLTVSGFRGAQTPVSIRVPLRISYDIGFVERDGRYDIVADWFGVRGIKQREFEQKLAQRYAYHAARSKMEQQGFDLVEEAQEGGAIRLVLRRTA